MSVVETSSKSKQGHEVFAITHLAEVQSPIVLDVRDELEAPSDFEEAVEATGYGLFNWLLLLAVLPGGWACFFNVTAMSYIIPSAECDLELTMFHKGVLNAITYGGMVFSAFLWGFLADVRGRRSLLTIGYLADFICAVLCSLSQSFYVMVAFKFLGGCIINGPYAISMTYVAEFHGSKHRTKVLLWAAIFPNMASIVLPGLAWLIIPQSWALTLLDGAFVYNSWRIFLLVCSLPALLAFLTLFYFPESPKFLMSQGRNDEALKVLQRMYAMNTGKPPETFSVKELCQEGQKSQTERLAGGRTISIWDKTRSGWTQIKPLFLKPYLGRFLLIITIQFGSILSLNTLRLWVPQLFTLMENFDYENRDASLGPPTLCEMLTESSSHNATIIGEFNSTIINECVVTPVSSKIYINSMIIACTAVLSYTIAGNVVNLIGKKNLLLILYTTAAVCGFSLNWSPNSDVTLAIFSIYVSFASLSVATIISCIVDLMPTSLRTMAVSMTMCVGRSGALIGNLLFPVLFSAGCMVPFVFVGGFLIVCLFLSIFIPKLPEKLL